MNIAEYSIKHKVISWMFVVLMLVGGAISFLGLGQLEFPEFTIKQAMVVTPYPGASPSQVEEEVTLPIEDAIQQMWQVKHVTSVNSAGKSQIMVELLDTVNSKDVPQAWDELRRKVNDTVQRFPSGVLTPSVVDDFSDVYGYFLNLTGEGYSYRELENYADYLRRELVLVDGVRKVSVVGAPQEQIIIEFDVERLTALGVPAQQIVGRIPNMNVVSNSGRVLIDGNRVRISPTGEFASIDDIKSLLISPAGSTDLVRLGDIATVYKAIEETPSVIYKNRGQQTLSIGVSFKSGVNVVDVSASINQRMAELEDQQPLGMKFSVIYDQGSVVDKSVSGFVLNLFESVGIVIIVLLLFMGVKSGLLIGAVLLITIFGTFIVMNVMEIELQLISLGALIIALGMLVDNAIVVTEGILISLKKGMSRLEAAKETVKQTQWPLLGATVIAILAFAPIGLSPDSVGEFCNSLFKVLFISLFISWITAVTITPFFCHMLFKEPVILAPENTDSENDALYQGWFFDSFKWILRTVLHHRALSLVTVIAMLVAAVMGMGNVKNEFFPPSNTPIFFIDVWMPQGTDIRSTERFVDDVQQDFMQMQEKEPFGLVDITAVIGQGAQRFVLPYSPEKSYSSFAQLIVQMEDLETLTPAVGKLTNYLKQNYPQAQFKQRLMANGPSPAAKIEARIYGNDPEELRAIAAQYEDIMRAEPMLSNIRIDWGNKTLTIRPELDLPKATELGISKSDIDRVLLYNFNGTAIGSFRDGSHILPILMRAPQEDRNNVESLMGLQVWNNKYASYVPLMQVIKDMKSEVEDPVIMRRDRKRVLTVLADPTLGSGQTADSALRLVKDKIEAVHLPSGYELEWGGEYQSSVEAQTNVFASIPMGYLAMFLITIFLFNSVRQPLAIWINVPFAVIGVAFGLLSLDAPFSFMALLGLLSLTGMVIKNGIVLVDQINVELAEGRAPYDALFHSTVSRVRPVCMAAITTVLGMIPLLFDPFFMSMAVTIIFGLGFSTVLILLVLPVCYTFFFKIPVRD